MEPIEIQARGLVFSGLHAGSDDDPLLILLHGLPRTSWEWHHQIPVLAGLGYHVVAPDLRGYCDGARPLLVEDYVIGEFLADVLAIADEMGGRHCSFHLMGTSIGATISWHLAARHGERVKTLACINIPHPGAMAEVYDSQSGAEQRKKMSYMVNSRKEGNERATFNKTLRRMALPEQETQPYRDALENDDALPAVYHWYRALLNDPFREVPPSPVRMPTLFMWPPGAGNVSRVSAEATTRQVDAPYQFEVLEDAFNFALQMEPDRVSELLSAHLRRHGS